MEFLVSYNEARVGGGTRMEAWNSVMNASQVGLNTASLAGLALFFAVLLPILRAVFTAVVFQPLGHYFLTGAVKKDDGGGTLETRLVKWNESCWKALSYSSLAGLSLWAAWGEPWLLDSREYWTGCEAIPCLYAIPNKVTLVYGIECGHYLYSVPALLFWEKRRKDFLAQLSHHVATLVLISASYGVNLTRPGIIILLLHDVCDPWLELAKLGRYARSEATSTVNFVLFVLSWFAARIFYFPLVPMYSCAFLSLEHAAEHDLKTAPWWLICNGMLWFLWVLHVYWSTLILQVLIKALRPGSGLEDSREDDD